MTLAMAASVRLETVETPVQARGASDFAARLDAPSWDVKRFADGGYAVLSVRAVVEATPWAVRPDRTPSLRARSRHGLRRAGPSRRESRTYDLWVIAPASACIRVGKPSAERLVPLDDGGVLLARGLTAGSTIEHEIGVHIGSGKGLSHDLEYRLVASGSESFNLNWRDRWSY